MRYTARSSIFTSLVVAATVQASNEFLMQYNSPGAIGYTTSQYVNALPIGNGRLGAGIYGQPADELITINEDSIWSGPEQDRLNPNALGSLPALRTALLNDNVTLAADIAYANFTSNPTTSREYSFLADLVLQTSHTSYTNYQRTLDLQNAAVNVTYEWNGNTFSRSFFASYPASLIIGELESEVSRGLNFSLQWNRTGLNDGTRVGSVSAVGSNSLVLSAGLSTGAPNYTAIFTVTTPDGTVSINNNTLTVVDATSAVVYIGCETNYWNNGSSYTELESLVQSHISAAQKSSITELYQTHTQDFRTFFDRTNLTLESPATNTSLDISGRYKAYISGVADYALEALLFQFGRYLMISSSRANSLPPNLIGIWNPQSNAAWGGKFTTDLNVEMNHWLTETTGLSEMSYQLFNFTKNRVMPNGAKTAQVLYNCSGWCSHHNNDLWGDTAPHDEGTAYTYWPMGGAWPMTHLYEHYRFTGDTAFLEDVALPILTGLIEFFNDFLIERDGYLVTAPSAATENGYITTSGVWQNIAINPTSDSYYLREILTNFINASTIVGSTNLVSEAEGLLSKIRTPFIPNYYGGISQWWNPEWTEQNNNNPMIDPLVGLYPFAQINTWEPNGNVTAMAEKTLTFFLGETKDACSWSIVWPIAYWARLWNGPQAYGWLHGTLEWLVSYSGATWTMNAGNYQIDGNLGFPAGIAEMLLQSNGPDNKWPLFLLPALPTQWAGGSVQGLGARGGFTVDIAWTNGSFSNATILSKLGNSLNLTVFELPGENTEFYITELDKTSTNGNLVVDTNAGDTYSITLA